MGAILTALQTAIIGGIDKAADISGVIYGALGAAGSTIVDGIKAFIS